MVDVAGKEATQRQASASATLLMNQSAFDALSDPDYKKGDVLGVVRIAAIQAAKKTSTLIPLCHQVPLSSCKVRVVPHESSGSEGAYCVRIEADVKAMYQTGVEMEALTAVSVGALTLYDMLKAVDRGMQIGPVQLEQKSGGRSGEFRR